jgi:hypothetical protein
MSRVKDVLDQKGRTVFSIEAGKTVLDAIEMMVAKDVAALVTDAGREFWSSLQLNSLPTNLKGRGGQQGGARMRTVSISSFAQRHSAFGSDSRDISPNF